MLNLPRRILVLLCAVLIISSSAVFAVDKEMMNKANELMKAKKWMEAAEVLQDITNADHNNGEAWFKQGLALHSAGNYKNAIEAYTQAERAGYAPTFTRYNLACSYALSGQSEKAVQALESALEAGFGNVELLKTDSDLENIRSHEKFAEILSMADRNSSPCEYDPYSRQLDFWLGEWDVYAPSGQQVGINKIEKTLNGCVIHESWSGAGNSKGESINYYDHDIGKWHQNWVSDRGNVIIYEGEFRDGAMHLSGKSVNKKARWNCQR